MTMYEAKGDFFPPPEDESDEESSVPHFHAILSFEKGDVFEVLEMNEDVWWSACALKDGAIGFIPANYVKKKQLPLNEVLSEDDPTVVSARELHLQTLAELQRRENFRHPGCCYPEMIPDPDYSDSDDEREMGQRRAGEDPNSKATLNGDVSDDGLIVPRKLSNPCIDSKDRQKLHKELMFNQKIGRNVLNQKSELQKAMDKFQDDQKKKELEQEQLTRRTSLEKRLEEQATKLKNREDQDQKKPDVDIPQSEFMRVHAKVRARMDSQ